MLDHRQIKFNKLKKIFCLLIENDDAIRYWQNSSVDDDSDLSQKMLANAEAQRDFLLEGFQDTAADLCAMFSTV